MNNLIIKRSQLVEATFVGGAAAGKKYQFTEVPNLSRNNIIVYGFEAFTATQLSITRLFLQRIVTTSL
jgi:spore maturation protein SpmB